MSQRLLGMLVAVGFALATPFAANADTPCGCGQVAAHVEIATVVP